MSVSSNVVDRFDSAIEDQISKYKELLLAIHNKKNQQSLHSFLAKQTTFAVLIRAEVFFHDVIVAKISESPAKFLQEVGSRVEQSISEKFGQSVARACRYQKPKTVSIKAIESVLDAKGWNLTFKDSKKLSEIANAHLNAGEAIKFSLDKADAEFFDFQIATRNCIAHGSQGSRSIFVGRVRNIVETANHGIGLATFSGQIDSYLKAEVVGKERVVFISDRIRDISKKFG